MASFQIDRFQYVPGIHHGKEIIWIHFPYNQELKNHLREHIHVHWSNTQKCWYAYNVEAYRKLFGLPEKEVAERVILQIHENNKEAFVQYRNLLKLKSYSANTLRTYLTEFGAFLVLLKQHKADDLSPEQLQSYFLYCIDRLKLSENQIHSRLNALKFYYEQVLHREKMFLNIPRPKKQKQLPKVLSAKELERIFSLVINPKHLLILKLCYGMGLRVSEIVNLKIEHIDSSRMQVLIESAKGKKDRYVTLPQSVLEELRNYYIVYRPQGPYLFEGQYGDRYSKRSVQAVFQQALKKAGIRKKIGVHGLRHSYATHLLEYGTDISLIQKLLGHNDIKTTMLYTHVSNTSLEKVVSPLDRIRKT